MDAPDLSPAQIKTFQGMFKGYYRWVVGLFHRMGFGAEESEDLAQETFLRVYRSMNNFRGESISGYLGTVVRHVGYNAIRDRKAAKRKADEVSLDGLIHEPAELKQNSETGDRPPSPEEQVLIKESEASRQQRLAEGLRRLPPAQLQALSLNLQEFKYREIADLLDISLDAVKSRIHAGKRTLAKLIETQIGESGEPCEGEGGDEHR